MFVADNLNKNFNIEKKFQLFSSLFDILTEAVLIIDIITKKTIYANESFSKLFLFDLNDFTTDNFKFDFSVNKSIYEICDSQNRKILCQVKYKELQIDSNTFNVFVFEKIESEQKSALVNYYRNQQQKYLNNLNIGFVYHDKSGVIINANMAAEKILGLSFEQLIGKKSIDKSWHSIRENGSKFPGNEHPAMIALSTKNNVENQIMGVFNPSTNAYNWININAIIDIDPNNNEIAGVYAFFEDITQKQKYLENLLLTNDLFAIGPVVIFTWGIGQNFPVEYVTPNIINVLGYNPEDFYLENINFRNIIHSDDWDRVVSEINNSKTHKLNIVNHEPYRLLRKDGKYIYVKDHTSIVRDNFGKIIKYIGYLYDITELKEHERKLEKTIQDFEWKNWELESVQKELIESENRWQFALESGKNGIWDWDLESDKVYFSKNWKNMLGYDEHEISNSLSEWDRFIHPKDKEKTYVVLNRYLRGDSEIYESEHRLKHKNGEYLWILDRGKIIERDSNGKPLRMIGTHTDITQQKISDENNYRLASIIENSPDIIVIKDRNLRVLATNQAFAEAAGKSSVADLIGKTDAEIFGLSSEQEPIRTYIEDELKAQKLSCGEYIEREEIVLLPDGNKKTVFTRKFPVYNKYNILLGTANISADITKRKNIESKLLENQKLLDLAMIGTNLAMWFFDVKRAYFTMYSEEVWQKVLGYSKKDFRLITFATWESLIHPEDYDKAILNLNQAVYGEIDTMYMDEYRMKHKNGYWIWVSVRGKVSERNEQNIPLKMQGTLIDINDRKIIEEELKESEETYRIMFEESSDAYLIIQDEIIAQCNSITEKMLQLPKSEIIGKQPYELSPEFQIDNINSKELAHEKLQETLNIGKNKFEWIHKRADGSNIYVEVSLNLMNLRGKQVFFTSWRDITERKRAEERLALMANMTDLAPSSIILVDMQGYVLYANQSTFKMHGYEDEEFYGLHISDIDLPEEVNEIETKIQNLIAKGESRFEVYHRRKDGSIFPLDVFNKIIEWNGEKVILSISNDISKRKNLEFLFEEKQERLTLATQGAEIGIWDLDVMNNELVWDKQVYNFFEVTPEEFPNPKDAWSRFVNNDDQLLIGNAIQELIKNNKEFNCIFRIKLKDASTRFIKTLAISKTDKKNNICRVIGTNWDITDQINFENQIKESEEKFSKIGSSALDAIVLMNEKGLVEYWNPAAERIFGYCEDEIKGTFIHDIIMPDKYNNIFTKGWAKYKQTGEGNAIGKVLELSAINKKGEEFPIEIALSSILIKGQYWAVAYIKDITERKQFEKILLERDILLEKLSINIPGVIFQYQYHPDGENSFPFSSSNIEQIYEISPEEAKNDATKVFERIHPDDLERITDSIMNSYETLSLWKADYRVILPKRGLRWLRGIARPERLENGGVIWHGFIADITDNKHDEILLQQTKEQFELSVRGSNDGIWDWNIEDNNTYFSPKWKEQLGYEDHELPNDFSTFEQLLHPDDKEKVMNKIGEYFNDNSKIYEIEFRMEHKNGYYIWILARGEALRDENGLPYRMAGSHSDITKRKNAEESLNKYAEMHKLLTNIASKYINLPLDQVHDSIQESLQEMAEFVKADRAYIFDYDWINETSNNTYEYCAEGISPQIEELQSIPLSILDEWIKIHSKGKTMYIQNVQELALENPIKEILESQDIKSLIAVPMMHGKVCLGFAGFDSVKSYHKYSDNELRILDLFTQMLVNIKLRKEGEEALIESKKDAERANQAKSEFLANISHEIRTPMNSILGFSEVLLNTIENSQHKGYLKTILNSGKTLLSLINDILDLSKIEAGKMEISAEPTDLRVLTYEIIQIFEQKVEEKGIFINLSVDNNFPVNITIDEVRLRQILLNIIGNAVKFTDIGGIEINIRILNIKDSLIDFYIDIIDTGIGISFNDKEKIFDSFSQQSGQDSRKYGGTGLGLAISKRLTELMNGDIKLESEIGKGSKFSIEFFNVKFSDSQLTHADEFQWNENEIEFENVNILIVDDVKSNRDLVVSFLEKYNLNIYQAEDGYSAIEIAKKINPDLTFMDIRMPGLNGYETTRSLRDSNQGKNLKIIALTASTMKSETDKIMQLFDGYLRKPVQKKSIVNEMCKYLKFKTIKPEQIYEKSYSFDNILKQIDNKSTNKIRDLIQNSKYSSLDQLVLIMNIDELLNFASEVSKFAEKENLDSLGLFAELLTNNINSFEFDIVEDAIMKLKNKIIECI